MLWSWIVTILVSAFVGWLAGSLMGNKNQGFIVNVILGIIGGIVGKLVFSLIGFTPTNIIGSAISGVVGTCILIGAYRFLTKK